MTPRKKFSQLPINRVSARIGWLLAALVPIVSIAFTSKFTQRNEPNAKAHPLISGSDTRLVQFCSENIKDTRAFVLFTHGTCVVVDNEPDPEVIKQKALEILAKTAKPDARFVCTPVEDHNIIVSYSEPVFHLRFKDEIELHRKEIEQDFRRFLTEEESADITPAWEPPFHAKVGLRSRARLLKDAASPLIARIIAPQNAEKAGANVAASVSF